MRRNMEETLCSIEILKISELYVARIQTGLGDIRELRSSTFEDILRQVALDLQEEFEVSL
jgi:hypothetical protein